MSREVAVELTNMCVVCDGTRVLVQDRVGRAWSGITFPGGHVEPGESITASVIREVKEETGLTLHPLTVDEMYEKQYFTTIGMTDECCATVYGYSEGEISSRWLEDTEDIEVVLADKEEVKRILKEEKVAIMCAYMLMHFLQDEEPFGFLQPPG